MILMEFVYYKKISRILVMEWEFNEKYWTEFDPAGVKFDGYYEGKRYIFFVSQIAINDYYRTVDSFEQMEVNFEDNRSHIDGIAERFAGDFDANEDIPHFKITSEYFSQYA
jgi:hypothetical protein